MSANPQQPPADPKQTLAEEYYKKKGYTGSDVALAIIGAGVANAVALLAINTPFTLWNMIVGITILSILFAYAPAPTAKPRLFVAYAAAWAFSLLSGVGVLFNILYEWIIGRNSFPNYESTAPFYSFPTFIPDSTNISKFFFNQYIYTDQQTGEMFKVFTPFNVYDVMFFLAWAVVFLLCFLVLLYRRRRHLTSDSPKLNPQPGSETPRAKDSGTPTTSGHVSDTPKPGMGEVH